MDLCVDMFQSISFFSMKIIPKNRTLIEKLNKELNVNPLMMIKYHQLQTYIKYMFNRKLIVTLICDSSGCKKNIEQELGIQTLIKKIYKL